MMKVNDDNNPFFHKKGNNIFNWLSWIIEDNLPFTFCERPSTRKFSKLDSISGNLQTLLTLPNKKHQTYRPY